MAWNVLAGLVLSSLVALLGYWRRSLSPSGVIGAILTGTLIFALGGLGWAIVLIAFFVSSSALSHFRARTKASLADKFQKGSRRDLFQALANGGLGALLALLSAFFPSPLLFVAFSGAFAAVTADTWATEVGVLSSRAPRQITTGRAVPVGTSGGITLLGTGTALSGALFIGVIAGLVAFLSAILDRAGMTLSAAPLPAPWFPLVWVSGLAGLGGSLFDSLLGATVQAIYYCDYDQKETEQRIHSCGRSTRLVRGFVWFDNDLVNLLASVMGVLLALLFWTLQARP